MFKELEAARCERDGAIVGGETGVAPFEDGHNDAPFPQSWNHPDVGKQNTRRVEHGVSNIGVTVRTGMNGGRERRGNSFFSGGRGLSHGEAPQEAGRGGERGCACGGKGEGEGERAAFQGSGGGGGERGERGGG